MSHPCVSWVWSETASTEHWHQWPLLLKCRKTTNYSLTHLMLSPMSASVAAITKWFLFNIWKSIRASNFKIYHNVVLDSLYILTRNVATIYFRSAANHTNVSILVMFWSHFLDNSSVVSEKVHSLKRVNPVLLFIIHDPWDIFAHWLRKYGSVQPSSTYYIKKWRSAATFFHNCSRQLHHHKMSFLENLRNY